jgi:hypothetical protein
VFYVAGQDQIYFWVPSRYGGDFGDQLDACHKFCQPLALEERQCLSVPATNLEDPLRTAVNEIQQ